MNTQNNYRNTITSSQLLHPYEKQVMGEIPEGLPDDFRDSLTALLKGFDARSNARREELIAKICEVFVVYANDIEALAGIDTKRKDALLFQAATLEKTMLTKLLPR